MTASVNEESRVEKLKLLQHTVAIKKKLAVLWTVVRIFPLL